MRPDTAEAAILCDFMACWASFPNSVAALPQTYWNPAGTLQAQFCNLGRALGTTMKKILAGAAALLGTAVSAQAADMAVKAPYLKAPVAMVYDWTGFYIGVNAGVGLGRDYTRLAVPAGPSFEASYLGPQGALGGGQVGYNYQTSSSFFGGPLVFGLEADIQGTGMRDGFTCGLGCPGPLAASS